LWQVSKPTLAQHLAGVWLDGTAEHFEKCGLTGSVTPHQACFVAWHHSERRFFHNHASANFDRKTLDL
jgi:hypothetical protein